MLLEWKELISILQIYYCNLIIYQFTRATQEVVANLMLWVLMMVGPVVNRTLLEVVVAVPLSKKMTGIKNLLFLCRVA